jgi:hypothetical protein
MSDSEGNRPGVVGSTEFLCTIGWKTSIVATKLGFSCMNAMENLRSCDEIQGFRVRPRWKTSVVVTKFRVSKSVESETAHAWGVSMSGHDGNRPSTSVRNLGVSMSSRDGTHPKVQAWETRGFHVRPQRKPPKIASVGNLGFPCSTAMKETQA